MAYRAESTDKTKSMAGINSNNKVIGINNTQANIPSNAVDSYAIQDETIENAQNDKINNVEKMVNEFMINFRNSRNARYSYERKWQDVYRFLWGEGLEFLRGKNDKGVNSVGVKDAGMPTDTSQNYLWSIFTYKLAELCANDTMEVSIEPNAIPQGEYLKQVEETTAELEKLGLDEEELASMIEDVTQQMFSMYMQSTLSFNEIIQQNWKNMVTDELFKKVFMDGLTFGSSFLELAYNPNRDGVDIEAIHIPLQDCFLEPGVRQFQNSRYFITSQFTDLITLKSTEIIKKNWSKELEAAIISSAVSQNNTQHLSTEHTSHSRVVGNEQIQYHRYFKKYIDSSGKIKIGCYGFVGNVDEPILVYAINDIEYNRFPFAPLFFNKRTDALYGKSILDFLLPTQKLINKYEAIVKLRLIQSARPHVFLARGSGIDPKNFSSTRLTPGVVHITNKDNPKEAIYIAQLDSIPGDFTNFLDRAQQNLRDISNMSEAYMGQNKISGAGTGAAETQNARATLPDHLTALDVKAFIRDAVEIMIQIITIKQSDAKSLVVRETNPNSVETFSLLQYTGTDFSNLSFNLNVNIKILSASEKQQLAQAMMQMYQLSVQFPGLQQIVTEEELVKVMDWPTAQQALLRLQAERSKQKYEIAQQIVSSIGENIAMALQAQQAQIEAQQAMMDGVDEQEANDYAQNQPQPLDAEQMVEMVVQLMDTNPLEMANQAGSPANAQGFNDQQQGEN